MSPYKSPIVTSDNYQVTLALICEKAVQVFILSKQVFKVSPISSHTGIIIIIMVVYLQN